MRRFGCGRAGACVVSAPLKLKHLVGSAVPIVEARLDKDWDCERGHDLLVVDAARPRREVIPEVMRDQRVLRTLRPALITSPDDQTACPEPWGT